MREGAGHQRVNGPMRRLFALLTATFLAACGDMVGGCPPRETGAVLTVLQEVVVAGQTLTFDVTSPVNSNLIVVVTWEDIGRDLQLTATDIDCAGISGACPYTSNGRREYEDNLCSGTPYGPGNPGCNKTPNLALLHDGQKGRRIRVSVTGDLVADVVFDLYVTFDTGTCT